MSESSFVPEIGLATCLLFICIEFFRGNYGTAFTHMTNGLRLIRDWTNDSISITRPGTLIEHMLLPMFQRGVTSALLYGVAAEEHYDIPVPDPNAFIKLPFSLLEAERTSRELRNASIVFVRNVSIKWHGGIAPSWEDLQTQAQLIACHQRWLHHVESFSNSLPPSSTVDRVSFSALKVVQYATFVHVACATSTHQTAYDAYLPTFYALLDEAEIVLDAISASKPTSPAANFTFEISLVAPLSHTATRCRCPTTRRRAISLLERGPPREGLWDAEQHVLVARRTVELEERELDPESGWPVERTRLYSSVIDANMDAAGGFWVYFLPSEWIGMLDEAGKQRMLQERFVM
ncbi:hypothetical protein E8E13_004765 [Curvularia kusanoi]|uniref:Uncharacterized protein n=1 Tax=Curvularia kusanoi TaxID=90978 RepID=A0A9P4T5I8_CURKU|nr:hypothetical protein E8E13_004765 [Curvularia kusanoi]